MVSVLVLTLNEEVNIGACLDSVAFSDDRHVLDSGSTDRTLELARGRGATVSHRPMDDWASQLNHAVRELPFRHPWVLMIDADERATPKLGRSVLAAVADPGDAAAFELRRRDFFMGRELRRAQATRWYVRLFRPERVSFSRLVNPITHVGGPVGRLEGDLLHHPFSKGLAQWIERHNAYSTLEARQELAQELEQDRAGTRPSTSGLLLDSLFRGDPRERRRHQKLLLSRLPLRPLARFLAFYAARGGFLDGRAGLTYALLQAWYEHMIVLKKREMLAAGRRQEA